MEIKVNVPGRPYIVRVGESIDNFGNRLREYTEVNKVFVITNTTVGKLYNEKLYESLEGSGFQSLIVEVADGEKYKTLDTVRQIYNRMSDEKIDDLLMG